MVRDSWDTPSCSGQKKKRCSMGCTVVPHVLMRSLNPLRSLHPNIVPPGASAEGPVEGPIFPSRCPAQPPYGLTSLGLVPVEGYEFRELHSRSISPTGKTATSGDSGFPVPCFVESK